MFARRRERQHHFSFVVGLTTKQFVFICHDQRCPQVTLTHQMLNAIRIFYHFVREKKSNLRFILTWNELCIRFVYFIARNYMISALPNEMTTKIQSANDYKRKFFGFETVKIFICFCIVNAFALCVGSFHFS